jgi:hypothetical protein
MGLGFVLIFWAAAGSFLATAGLFALGGTTAYLTRGVAAGRRRAIIASGLFPFVCLGWASIVFFFQAFINQAYFERDPGLGDTWECPLPNGYHVLMIDITDEGTVYNPRTQKFPGGVGSQEDAVFGVRTLQVAGPYLLGGVDTKFSDHLGDEKQTIDSYFVIDCRSGKRTNFPTLDLIRKAAQLVGVQLNLEPIAVVYSEYFYTWFQTLTQFLYAVPPIIGFSLLVRWVIRLRRTRAGTGEPASPPLAGTA